MRYAKAHCVHHMVPSAIRDGRNANRSHNELPTAPHPSGCWKSKAREELVDKDLENLEPSYTAAESVKQCRYCEKVWQFLKK